MSAQRANQLVEAGLWLRLSGDHEGARRLFEQALRLDPSNEKARQLISSGQLSTSPMPLPPLPDQPVPSPPPISPLSSNPFEPPKKASPSASVLEVDWGMATGLGSLEADPSGSAAPAVLPVVRPPPKELAADATSAWDFKSNPGVALSEVRAPRNDALDLMLADDAEAKRSPADEAVDEVQTLLRGAKDLLELDDHSGAMDLLQKAQELAPNDPDVQQMRAKSERVLQAMFESKLGDLSSVPRVALKDDEIIWLNLDHRAGFVLAQIDGTVTFEDLFAVSGMSRLDTARILAQLVEEGVITRG
ncbi:MAG: tetratricopeptide repeat protein [Myxococcota bacterium]